MPPKHFTKETLAEIFNAAVEVGLVGSRAALLGGVDQGFVVGLQIHPQPATQLQLDLTALNAEPSLDDDSVPIESWLSTAVMLAGPRRQAAVFKKALAELKAALAGNGAAAGSAPVATWNGKLSGPEYESLVNALVAAFHTPEALTEMVRFKLNRNLAEIATGAGLRSVVFNLIAAAESQGWTRDLVVGALDANPGSPSLAAFASAHGVVKKA